MCRAPFANGIHSTAVLSFTSHFFFLHFAPLYSNEQMYLKRSNANSNVRYFDATPVIAGADEPRLIVITEQKKKKPFFGAHFSLSMRGLSKRYLERGGRVGLVQFGHRLHQYGYECERRSREQRQWLKYLF